MPHFFVALEPFVPTPADSTASIRAAVGGSQQGSFQDLPLNVCVADALQFGRSSSSFLNDIAFLWLSLHYSKGCGFKK